MANQHRTCVYCGSTHGSKLTKEHVISHTVLQAAFDKSYGHLTWGTSSGNKVLPNHEQTIRDVCEKCNNGLSPYDDAGALLVIEIDKHSDGYCVVLPFSDDILGWLVKTHLNLIRLSPDAATGMQYTVDAALYAALRDHNPVPTGKFRLYMGGWRGTERVWDPSNPYRQPYFHHLSIGGTSARVLVSTLRLKWLETFLLLPTDADYTNFPIREGQVVSLFAEKTGYWMEELNVNAAITAGGFTVTNLVSTTTNGRGVTRSALTPWDGRRSGPR